MDKTKQRFEIGSRVICKSWKELMAAALMLSSKGYKIEIESLIGSMDMTEIVLTITALPEENDQIESESMDDFIRTRIRR